MEHPEATASAVPVSLSPQHLWEAAAEIIYPVLRPAGTPGLRLDDVTAPSEGAGNVEPLIDDGPVDLVIAYAIAGRRLRRRRQRRPPLGLGRHPGHGPRRGVPEPGGLGARRRHGRRRSPIAAASSRPTRATAGTPAASCCPTPWRTCEAELAGAGAGAIVGLPARHLLIVGCLATRGPGVRRALRRLRPRVRGRLGRVDRPTRLRAARRAARRSSTRRAPDARRTALGRRPGGGPEA